MAKEQKVTRLRPTEVAEGRPSIRMTNDRILVRRPGSEERKTKAGLLIPATAADGGKRTVWAEVVAVGPNVRTSSSATTSSSARRPATKRRSAARTSSCCASARCTPSRREQSDSGTGLYL